MGGTPSRTVEARTSRQSARLRGRLDLPANWVVADTGGPGPFVTRATIVRTDGSVLLWSSRFNRKHEQMLDDGRGSTWWAPRAIAWWIGVLFAIGSICFAVGALPGYATAAGLTADGITFFAGSLFFTTAALLLYLEVANTSRTPPGSGTSGQRWRLVTWEPARIEWWAALVQLIGTIFFNVSTLAALHASTVQQQNRRVWTPDALGSICFLVASWLAWSEVCGRWWAWSPRLNSWRIAAVNLAGSVAFGASALASHVVPSTQQVRNESLMTLGTFVGAICFLLGAVLLLPERTSEEGAPSPSPSAAELV